MINYLLTIYIFWVLSVVETLKVNSDLYDREESVVVDAKNYTDDSKSILNTTENTSDIENLCKWNTCIRKCCPKGKYFTSTCVEFNGTADDLLTEYSIDIQNFTVVTGFPPNPDSNKVCIRHTKSDFTILDNGQVLLHDRQILLDADHYCIDLTHSGNASYGNVAGLCYEPLRHPKIHLTAIKFQTGGHLASCSFLVVLIVMHICTPNLRSSLHGKCFFSMCVSLLFGYSSLIVIITPITNYFNETACIAAGLAVQYFMLSFWFWLTTRCYETLRIVRGTVKAIPLHLLNSSQNRFVKYSLISWGFPLLISSLTLVMQTMEDLPEDLKPGIAHNRCWIREKLVPLAIYYYGHQVLLHFLNIVFMTWCVYLLWTTGEAFQCLSRNREKRLVAHNKKSLRMFWQQFYIFLLYIVILSLDSVSLISSKLVYWKIIDIINSFQGVIIFLIFTLSNRKKNIFSYVWNRTSNMAKTLSTKLTPLKSSTRSNDNQPKESPEAEDPV